MVLNGQKSYQDEKFIKSYNQNSDKGYFLEVDSIPKTYLILIKIYFFLPERKEIGKVEKLVCGIEDNEKFIVHIRALKQALNHGLK